LKVAVIGAGPAGLVSAKIFRDNPNIREVKVFECREDLGGQWFYSPLGTKDTPDDDLHKQLYGVAQCSIYDELYLNFPAASMNFSGLSKVYSKTFCHRSEVFAYYKEYAEHFDLYRLINFNTAVTLVNPLTEEEIEVTTRNKQGEETSEVFNRVAVCIGNFSVPFIPTFEGQDSFTGRISIFKDFKHLLPEEFEGKTILIVGGGASCLDALKVLLVACSSTRVILSGDGFIMSLFIESPDIQLFIQEGRLIVKPRIASISGGVVKFADSSEQSVDEVVLCSGYVHKLPFLPHQVLSEEGRYLENLYKGMIDALHPRIAHISLFKGLAAVRLEQSARFVLQEWLRNPDIEMMRRVIAEDEREYTEAGKPKRKTYESLIIPRQLFAFFSNLGIESDPAVQDYLNRVFGQMFAGIKTLSLSYKDCEYS